MSRGVLGLVLVVTACAGAGDELDELDELEAAQLDCRPVLIDGCVNAWNARACFYVPPECATRAQPPATE